MGFFVDFHEEAFPAAQEALGGKTEGQVKCVLDCRCKKGREETASREDLGSIADVRSLMSFDQRRSGKAQWE
jgi:hypothetical protein